MEGQAKEEKKEAKEEKKEAKEEKKEAKEDGKEDSKADRPTNERSRRGSFARFSLRKAKDSKAVCSGRWNDCSEEQLNILEELKAKLPNRPARYDDVRLLRFLRARAFDLEKTKTMIEEDIKWREEEGIDNLSETYYKEELAKEFEKYWPRTQHGVSKDGLPIFYERLGTVDAKGIIKTFPVETMSKYHIYLMEKCEKELDAASKKSGRPRDEGVYFITDLAGLGWRQFHMPALSVFMDFLKADALHYPELIKKVFIINVPSIFSIFWQLVKPIMDPRTVEKTEIFSTDYMATLEKEIDIEQLSRVIGGKCKCQIQPCLFGGGDIVPSNEDGYKEVLVGARGTHEEKIVVHQENSVLAWEFSTVGFNIQFGLFHESTESKVDVIPMSKVESQDTPQTGSITCKMGTYTIKWDNSHSMIRSKPLKYRVVLQEPPEDTQESKKRKKKKKKRSKKKEGETEQTERQEQNESKEEVEEEQEEQEDSQPDFKQEEPDFKQEAKPQTVPAEEKLKKKKKKKSAPESKEESKQKDSKEKEPKKEEPKKEEPKKEEPKKEEPKKEESKQKDSKEKEAKKEEPKKEESKQKESNQEQEETEEGQKQRSSEETQSESKKKKKKKKSQETSPEKKKEPKKEESKQKDDREETGLKSSGDGIEEKKEEPKKEELKKEEQKSKKKKKKEKG